MVKKVRVLLLTLALSLVGIIGLAAPAQAWDGVIIPDSANRAFVEADCWANETVVQMPSEFAQHGWGSRDPQWRCMNVSNLNCPRNMDLERSQWGDVEWRCVMRPSFWERVNLVRVTEVLSLMIVIGMMLSSIILSLSRITKTKKKRYTLAIPAGITLSFLAITMLTSSILFVSNVNLSWSPISHEIISVRWLVAMAIAMFGAGIAAITIKLLERKTEESGKGHKQDCPLFVEVEEELPLEFESADELRQAYRELKEIQNSENTATKSDESQNEVSILKEKEDETTKAPEEEFNPWATVKIN